MAEKTTEKKKQISDVLVETFERYEPKHETLPFPVITSKVEEQKRTPQPTAKQTIKELPMSRQVRTGIVGLDNVLGGGTVDHSLVLIIGEPGSHHETFAQQVLYNQIQEKGKTAYYNNQTLSIDIRSEMDRLGWSLQDALGTGSWIFINLRSRELEQLADLMPSLLSDEYSVKLKPGLVALKNDLLEQIKQGRWTALELSHLLLSYDLTEVIDLMLYWRAAIRVYGGLHFAILPAGVHSDSQVNALRNLADGVLEFSLREGRHEYESVMAIKKLRNLRKPLILPFTVEENGVTIETASRIA